MDPPIFFDWISANDLEAAHQIEADGYPPDEAATLDAFKFRQSRAPELFLAAYESPRTIIGYVCSTLSASPLLTHESMSTHVPDAKSVCLHSVCVAIRYRRRGLGVRMLAEYAKRLESKGLYERILLISHEELRGFYEKAGFEWIGESQVQHGARPWFEMRRILAPPTAQGSLAEQALPPGLLEALQQRPSHNKRLAGALSTFPGGIKDVLVTNSPDSPPTNKHDLVCPRPNCGSVILKAGVATLAERPSVQLEPVGVAAHPLLPTLPEPPTPCHWWLVMPSPMAFENIGFSRPVSMSSEGQAQTSQPPMKLLSCAECDLGPLGWCFQGGTEFWLACVRVAYRDAVE